MAFDDLARHMSSRDGKRKLRTPAMSGDEIMAEAARADRRMTRARNLILGTILFVGGALMLALYLLYLADANDPNPSRLRPHEDYYLVFPGWPALFIGAMIMGVTQVFRGLRGPRATTRS